jgi:hypothetical protein
MKASAFRKVLFCLACALILFSQQARDASAYSLQYKLIIENPGSHQARVQLTVSGISAATYYIIVRGYIEGLGIDVNALTARKMDGTPLSVDLIPGSLGDTWTIHCTGVSQFIIEYTTLPKRWGESYYSYVADDFAVFLSEYVFIRPPDSTGLSSLTVTFQVPQGWQVHTSWPEISGVYYPLNLPASAEPLKLFAMGAIALGQFESHTRRIDAADVTVAVYSGWPQAFRDEMIYKVQNIFASMARTWGTSISAPYLFAFCPYASDGREIFGGMTNLGRIMSFPTAAIPYGAFTWTNIAGETSDARWTGYDWGIVDDAESAWLRSAINSFSGIKTCFGSRNCTAADAEGLVDFVYDNYYDNYLAVGKDWALHSAESAAYYYYGMVKGPLVLCLMAKEIYQTTGGSKTIDELYRQLFAKYGFTHSVDETKLKAELLLLTGADFTQFFNDYIYGTTRIPIEWFFQDDDGDGLKNVVEILADTDWTRADTDSDGLSDSWEVQHAFNPRRFDSGQKADFNSDGKIDLLWRHVTSGQLAAWYMNGAAFVSSVGISTVSDLNWQVAGVADFNNNGKPDILWRHASTGQVALWYMNGASYASSTGIATVDTNWQIAGVADFNDDGKPDILWRHAITGTVALWVMNGTSIVSAAGIATVGDLNWQIVGVADFTADGKPDILWRNQATGEIAIWYMDGANLLYPRAVATIGDLSWQISGVADFNADGKPDVLWRNTSTGQIALWYMNGPVFTSSAGIATIPTDWQIVAPR